MLTLISANVLFSQALFKQSVFFELGGNAYYYSINYERQWAKGLAGRIGAAYAHNTFILPLTMGRIYGKAQHHFEFSAGAAVARKSELARRPRYFIDITGFIGYRFQKPEGKLFFRAGFTPLWEVYETDYPVDLLHSPFYPWGGIGLGARF